MRFVLDASVTCAWYLRNQATDYSIAVYRAVMIEKKHQAIVPEVWATEVSHVLIRAIGRRLITRMQCRQALEQLSVFKPEVRALDLSPAAIFGLHLRWGTSGFDTIYLALANSFGIPVSAHDKPMLRAGAERAGVSLFAP